MFVGQKYKNTKTLKYYNTNYLPPNIGFSKDNVHYNVLGSSTGM